VNTVNPLITRRCESQELTKSDGTFVQYYLFPEYEVHYNELPAGICQQWHHHTTIEETIYMVSGQLNLDWLDAGKLSTDVLRQGDLARLGSAPHALRNDSATAASFLVLKLVLDGTEKCAVFREDKQIDEPPGSTGDK
jgi:uncharacterized RmlC-like cupin family protein